MSTRNPRNLAANLRHLANLIESANIDEFAAPVDLSVYVSPTMPCNNEAQKAAIDQIAAAITGQAATWDGGVSGQFASYQTRLKGGEDWTLTSSGFMRRPDPADELRAENERLREALKDIAARAAAGHEDGAR